LNRELKLAKIDAEHLKNALNLIDDCPEEFRIVSNT
jgi:hypothetical protein